MLDGDKLSWEEGWAYIEKAYEEGKKLREERQKQNRNNTKIMQLEPRCTRTVVFVYHF